ncbi:MAG: hypothetical protein M3P84_05405 [Chloroflexota bacterium]|nr:hypothetical protein [Chloroflexota bacterium]
MNRPSSLTRVALTRAMLALIVPALLAPVLVAGAASVLAASSGPIHVRIEIEHSLRARGVQRARGPAGGRRAA